METRLPRRRNNCPNQADVTAAEHQQMLGKLVELHDGCAVEIGHIFQAFDLGNRGRHPALMKICWAERVRREPSFSLMAIDFGPRKTGIAKNQIKVGRFFRGALTAVSKAIDDVALAFANAGHIDVNFPVSTP